MKANLLLILFPFLLVIEIFPQTPDDFNKFRLAQSYEAIGNYDKAFELYKELYFRYPSQYQFYESYYRILFQLKRYDEAVVLLKNRLKEQPKDFNLYGEIAVVYDRKGIKDSVEYFINQGINIDARNPVAYKFIANTLIQNRLFDKAIEILKLGKNRISDNDIFIIDLISLYSITLNYSDACYEMIELLKKQPQQISFVQSKLAQIISNPLALKTALEVFEKNYDRNSYPILKILSWLYFQNKDFKKAFDLTITIDKLVKSGGYEILDFANRALKEKFLIESIKAFEYLMDNYPDKPDLKAMSIIGLARSYEQLLDEEQNSKELAWKVFKPPVDSTDYRLREAIKYYTIIVNNYTLTDLVSESIYKIAYFYKEYFRNYQESRIKLQRLLNNYVLTEYYPKGLLLLATMEYLEGHLDGAENLYNQVRVFSRTTDLDRNFAQFQIAKILLQKGFIDSAKAVLSNIKQLPKNDIANDAIEYLMFIQELESDKNQIKVLLQIEKLIEEKKYNQLLAILKSMNLDDEYSIFQNRMRYILAEIYITLNQYSDALAQLTFLYNLKEKSIYSDKALYRIAQIFVWGLRDKSRAEENLTKLLTEFPNSIFVNEVRELIQRIQKE